MVLIFQVWQLAQISNFELNCCMVRTLDLSYFLDFLTFRFELRMYQLITKRF